MSETWDTMQMIVPALSLMAALQIKLLQTVHGDMA